MADIARALGDRQVNILSATTSQTCIALLIEGDDGDTALRAMSDLPVGMMQRFELHPGTALLCAVGEGLSATAGIAARVFSAVARRGVNVEMISAGASEVAYHFTVAEIDLQAAVQAVHEEFFVEEG